MSPQLVWLITGTTSGLGRRLVASVLARGDRVVATARSLAKLQALHPSGDSGNLHLVQLDVTAGFDAIKTAVDDAVSRWGKIDVLVNNAGTGCLGLLEESGTKMLREQFETNVFAVVDVTNAVLPYMRAQKQGTIVVIGSRSVWRADTAGIGTYAASKAAIHAITESLSSELAPFNVRVLLVAPGAFRTEGMYSIPFNVKNPISDYDDIRTSAIARFGSVPGTEPGDPVKAMETLVDTVRGEGSAEGKAWPTWLLLGHDAEKDLRTKWDKLRTTLEEWGSVVRGVWF
ncbi:NAD(P)-binding protein [Guyanagaster necrorhizus]|uniref:NAD(P)-binding protein n=1 Tax=Guyanagaster necrorhizus TaxID=856835 RepID=A0A9P7VJ59_9AGAR|nr:NAD(P)-binding protein [Guyanagaster necrorhizus MCA 3950]KAG7441462.1 NAD(P)-binding protein [Guyanagaster necrorhizus MCA 3950]